ncbi:MAG: hypothetical protein K8W52_04110 [Deltaproteobacteria bacterium]|nr:hypothetical protein [Deltaproteobacteria bacterium]
MRAILVALALAIPRIAAADLDPRVLVLPAEGAGPRGMPTLAADVGDALARGAARTTPTVARADATLSDTAVVVGCDPKLPACLDAVAAALNVDQVLFSRLRATGADATIEVTAVTREAEPSTREFTIHAASRAADLAAIEPAVVEMLESGEARRSAQVQHAVVIAPPPPPPPRPAPAAHPIWPIAVTAGGAALVIGGLAAWTVAAGKQGDIDAAPTGTSVELARLAALESSARRYATAGNALVIGGALVTAAGGYLWWRSRRAPAITIAPAIGAEHAQVVIGGVW